MAVHAQKEKKKISVCWGFSGDIRLVLTAAKFSPVYCMLGIKMTHYQYMHPLSKTLG